MSIEPHVMVCGFVAIATTISIVVSTLVICATVLKASQTVEQCLECADEENQPETQTSEQPPPQA
jgi:hypothetical protein